METPPNPQSSNDNLNFSFQIEKARQDLRKAEALADQAEKTYEALLEKSEMEAAFLRLLLRLP